MKAPSGAEQALGSVPVLVEHALDYLFKTAWNGTLTPSVGVEGGALRGETRGADHAQELIGR
jgi:hypothetical protein